MTARLASLANIQELAEQIAGAPVVALDTEFHAERRYIPRLYLVQLKPAGQDTWLVDPLVAGLLEAIARPLAEADWIVHGGSRDLTIMYQVLGALPRRVWDTQIAAGLVAGVYPGRFSHLTERWIGHKPDKAETLTNWSRRPLTPEQQSYAAQDAELLHPLWTALWDEAGQLGRQDLVRAACADAVEAALDPPPDDTTWRRVPGLPSLTRQQAAVLQELAAWREERAREGNQPTFSIASNAILIGLARSQPSTAEELRRNRRLPRGLANRFGTELIERIQRSAARPEWAWPRFVTPSTSNFRRLSWLSCFAECDAAQHNYAPRLGLPVELREDLVLDPPADPEALVAKIGGWRSALLGDRLLPALHGSVLLQMGDEVRIHHRSV